MVITSYHLAVASMFDTIADLLRGSAPDDLAHALGTDRTQTRRAMEIGLPALITGLRDKTLEPGGAQSLATMLDDSSASLPSDVGAYLTEGDPSRGAAMLDVAFGDRGEPALSALSGASGLSTRLLAQVMSVLAPLATGTLRANAPRDADGLRSYLAGSVDDLEAKGFGRVVELVSPDVPVEPAAPVAEVIEAAGPAELDHMVDELDADAAVGGTVVTGAFPDTPDFGDDVVVGIDDGDVPDFVADLDGPSMPDLSVPDAPDLSAPDVDIAVPDADLPDVAVPDFGPGPDLTAPDVVADVAAPDFGAPDVAATTTLTASGYPSDDIDASFGLDGETPIVEPKVDFDEGRGLSAMGWLWWLIGAILAVLVLLFLISQCTGDDETADGVTTGGDTTATAVPAADPTPDPLVAQRQAQLDNIIAEYPGVTGEVVGEVAVLNGTVADLRTKALLDGEVREAGLGVQNNVAVDESAAPAEPQGYSLNDLIAAQPELTTLASLLDQAGLGAALDANGPFTLFAPTNDAFAAIQTELNELQGDPERLSAYLQYHLLSGELTGADIAARPTVETISQEIIDVSVEGNSVRLNDFVPVLVADAEARNGVMHVISGVLTPPSEVPVPEELGSALELNAITFATGSADLTDGGRVELDKVVAFLLETPVDVVIGGHTDSDGDEALNQSLSQDRADAVLTYLTSQGVPADTLTATGFGETQPIAPNDTPENKAKNRRIEFRTN
jgi:outer membrane protein OmpA-like peptidoglycan-associated protein